MRLCRYCIYPRKTVEKDRDNNKERLYMLPKHVVIRHEKKFTRTIDQSLDGDSEIAFENDYGKGRDTSRIS